MNKGTSWIAFVHIQINFQEPLNETGDSPFGKSPVTPAQNFEEPLGPGSSPVSMMVGQVFTSTAPAASLDLSSLIKVWVVRIQAALLTCKDEHSFKQRVPAALPLQELMFRDSFIICSQFLLANLNSFLWLSHILLCFPFIKPPVQPRLHRPCQNL